MSDEEVATCDVACSIQLGRLQESLSLSHAVSISLCTLYSQRLAFVTGTSDGRQPYVVSSVDGLAAGYDTSEGREI
jgi:tRNA C32,U32 (ribose-2'-O)-methylase TrmJ